MYGNHIKMFEDTLKLHKTYTIVNAKVIDLLPQFNKFWYPYHWIINRRTAIHEEKDAIIPLSKLNFNFTPLRAIKSFIGQKTLIDVLGLVVEKRGQRYITSSGNQKNQSMLREYALMDQEGVVVTLALWNNVAVSEGPIIDNHHEILPLLRATGLTVSPHDGGTLGSTSSTVIVLDPRIPEAEALKAWRNDNLSSILSAVSTRKKCVRSRDLAIPPNNNISAVARVLSQNQADKFIVQVQAMVIDVTQKFFYMGCALCCSGFNADYGFVYRCSTCKKITQARPRETMVLTLFDASGFLDATVFGSQAYHITGINCINSMEMHNKGIPFPTFEINQKLDGKTFLMKLKKKARLVNQTIKYQYIVEKFYMEKSNNVQPLAEQQISLAGG